MGARNILFVMYDQLRHDYMGCAGHPHLETPNFDRLAAMGVRFSNAWCQSPICGASRMCFYTGRYASSHGAEWNGFPLRVAEMTLGDHLRKLGMNAWLIGKTHMRADAEGMARLGIDPASQAGMRAAEAGFDLWLRDDGMVPEGPDGSYDGRWSPYNEWLMVQGYPGPNPWAHHANAGIRDGQIASAWLLENSDLPANIREKDSETPWLTDRALEFMALHPGPWCAHLSYIKPHWPYIAPAPYHAMYGRNHVPAPHRHECELLDAHPVHAAMTAGKIAQAFQRDETRARVIPTYMGLIRQCDDQLGRVLDHLEQTGALADTMIVLTSDHGDYLGDHWMGEKMFMHDQGVRIPLIVYDPDPAADATRGATCDAMAESVDLAATFVDWAGGDVPAHWIEGRSLLPWLRGQTPGDWRDFVVSEYNYACTPIAGQLGVADHDARIFMVADDDWKLIHFEGGFRPMLFDRRNDPGEFNDLGASPDHAAARAAMYAKLHRWALRQSQRGTRSAADLAAMRGASGRRGVILGAYDMGDTTDELMSRYTGPVLADYTGG